MKLVVIESPYAGNRRRNDAYLVAAMRDSLNRGEAPFASHRMYPGVLDDDKPEERKLGIAAGLAWGEEAHLTAVYCDIGISDGMRHGIAAAMEEGREIEMRTVEGWTWPPKKT